ncbi:hypothetical protein BCR35DRAFT_313892, partial [Leucosporidium creatinivorum]
MSLSHNPVITLSFKVSHFSERPSPAPAGEASSSSSNNAAARANLPPKPSAWEVDPEEEKRAAAFYTLQGIVPSPQPNKMLQIAYHNDAFPPHAAASLRESARMVQNTRNQIPDNTIRFTFPLKDHGNLAQSTVMADLRRYYDNGRPSLPLLVEDLPQHLEYLRPSISSLSFSVQGQNSPKGVSHVYDLRFSSPNALRQALTLAPYHYANKPVHSQVSTTIYKDVLEFRFCYVPLSGAHPSGALLADCLLESFPTALKAEVLHVQRVLEVHSTFGKRLPTFTGNYTAYIKFPDLNSPDLTLRNGVFNQLPTSFSPFTDPVASANADYLTLHHDFEPCFNCGGTGHRSHRCPHPDRRAGPAWANPPTDDPATALQAAVPQAAAQEPQDPPAPAPTPQLNRPLAATNSNAIAVNPNRFAPLVETASQVVAALADVEMGAADDDEDSGSEPATQQETQRE